MDEYGARTYGEGWAEVYDEIYDPPRPEVVEFIAARADGGPVLELAIGTGRVAVPLIEAGVPVHGVEISRDMLAQLRRKGVDVPIVGSDMAGYRTEARYPLILLGFNTLFGELEEERQRDVFRSTAAALRPGGSFVIDCFVPDPDRFDRGQTVRTGEVRADRLIVEYSIHEKDRQMVRSMVEIRWMDGRTALLPVFVHYLWPDQIDGMADAEGLELAERYEWYDEAPFTDASPRHVSVYRRS